MEPVQLSGVLLLPIVKIGCIVIDCWTAVSIRKLIYEGEATFSESE